MRDVLAELKGLRLYGMAGAWEEIAAQGETLGLQTSGWLIEHLLQAEHVDRHARSIRYQMYSAKFPIHRDLAGFDFDHAKVDKTLVDELATMRFTEQAHNVVFIMRREAVIALGRMGCREHAGALLPLLRDISINSDAGAAIGRLGARRFADQIAPLLKDSDWRVRYAAVHALGQIGRASCRERVS
jgi:hypothetical protein